MQLSKNFSLAEMTKSQTAIRMGLANNPSEGEVENLRAYKDEDNYTRYKPIIGDA